MQLLLAALAALLAAMAVLGWLLYIWPSARTSAQPAASTVPSAAASTAAAAAAADAIAAAGSKPKKSKGGKHHQHGKGTTAADKHVDGADVVVNGLKQEQLTVVATAGQQQQRPKQQGEQLQAHGAPSQPSQQQKLEQQNGRQGPEQSSMAQGQQQASSQHSSVQEQNQHTADGDQQQQQQQQQSLSNGSDIARRASGTDAGGLSSDAASRSYVDESGAVVIGRLRVGPGVLGYGSAGARRVSRVQCGGPAQSGLPLVCVPVVPCTPHGCVLLSS